MSMGRLTSFLNNEEVDERAVTHEKKKDAIMIEEANFSWDRKEEPIISE